MGVEAKKLSLKQPLDVASFLLEHYLDGGRLQGRGNSSKNHYGVGKTARDLPGMDGHRGAVIVYGGHGGGAASEMQHGNARG